MVEWTEPALSFDAAEGRRRRDQAMAATDEAHADQVKAAWLDVIHTVTQRLTLFTTDDVVEHGLTIGLEEPREARLFGPLMLKASREGWCVKVQAVRPSNRPKLHATPLQVWLSTSRGETVKQCQACNGYGIVVETKGW